MRTPVLLSTLLLLLLSSAAQAGPPDGATPAPAPADEALQKELEKALQQDASGKSGAPGQAAAPGTSAPAAATAEPAPPPVNARGSQSLNPDLSAIVDADLGYERRAVAFRNGDDPDVKATTNSAGVGPAVQEVEVALSAIVDPYLKGEVYLTIPNLSGLEVEEAFATTTSLPGNLQVKAGSFRSAFGRQNGQHLHVQDFTRRPLLNAAFLGVDGLRGAGTQVSWLTPLPFYLTLYAEVFKLDAPAPTDPVASFGGGSGTDLTYTAIAKAFFPVSDDVSIYAGLNGATGVSHSYGVTAGDLEPFAVATSSRRAYLGGGDLYVKWKPANVAAGYQALSWQTEVIFRHLGDPTDCSTLAFRCPFKSEWDGGLYSQLVYQFARRWFVGVRGDLLGIPPSAAVSRTVRGGLSLTFQASEFARIRAYGELEHADNPTGFGLQLDPVHGPAQVSPGTSGAAYLQLEISIGAHGAHPF